MDYKISVVERPAMTLSVCRAETFPEGMRDAWERLETAVGSLRGRKFYGLSFLGEGVMTFYAGVESPGPAEQTELGFPTMEVDGGKFARVKLQGWPDRLDEIATVFQYIMSKHDMRAGAPAIEFYRSQSELHLLVPLAS